MTKALLATLSLLVAAIGPIAHADVTGHATVLDGDTIEIGDQRVRLYGIDAPEHDQTCAAETQWRCGDQATAALASIVGTDQLHCIEKDRDQYKRIVAVCHLSEPDGSDVNRQMVRQGWALAYRQYSMDYVAEEEAARKAQVGVWRGSVVPPWKWRAAQRVNELSPGSRRTTDRSVGTSAECNIKGNISAKGERIYHVPGGRYYAATQINPATGERWFCSEAEAKAAGWRRSKR